MTPHEFDDLLITEECTLTDALALLDKTARKILFVHSGGVLTAAVTDGDIRRWILAKGSLDARAKDFANYAPKYLYEKDKAQAAQYLKQKSIDAVPIVDDGLRIMSVVFCDDVSVDRRKTLDVPVVIMAGGLGTRLYPYTKILPKPLIPIGDTPIVEHIINRFCGCGCSDFYLIVNHRKNMIKAFFNEFARDYRITFIDEERPLGTGGGLSLVKDAIQRTFFFSNCDILINEDYEKIYEFHVKEENLITIVSSLKKFVIPYGVVELDANGSYEEMREKPQLSYLTNTGLYIAEPKVFKYIEENTPAGFPDIIQKAVDAGEKIGVYPISEKSWMDMGQFEELEEMRKRLEDNGG